MTAITPSYFQLLETAGTYLKDTQLTGDVLDEMLGVAEFEIERDLMSEEYGSGSPYQMLSRSTGQTAADSSYDLPSDYLGARSVLIGNSIARYVSSEKITSSAVGYGQADVVLDYYQTLSRLSPSNPFNWLIQAHFDVYLWAVCRQYPLWGHHVSDLAIWQPKYISAIRSAKRTSVGQPRGGNIVQKGRPYGAFYTIIGTKMLFGNLP